MILFKLVSKLYSSIVIYLDKKMNDLGFIFDLDLSDTLKIAYEENTGF